MLQLRGIVDLTGAEIRVIHEMHPVNCEVFHLKMVYESPFITCMLLEIYHGQTLSRNLRILSPYWAFNS